MPADAIGCESCGTDTVQRLPLFWASHPFLPAAELTATATPIVPVPPRRPHRLWLLAALTLAAGLAVLAALPGLPWDVRRILLAAMAVALLLGVAAIVRYRMRLDDWREEIETWAAQWICLRCGAVTDEAPQGRIERPRRAVER